MTIQEPVWRKRTRPCPFFSQGRCLFADSCNFLHDIKVRKAASQSHGAVQIEQPLPFVFDPPSLVVNSASPRSDSLASPQSPASSTQGSARYSGLLTVLSDVIGPPSDPSTAAEDAVPSSRAVSAAPSNLQDTTYDRTNFPGSTNTAAEMDTRQDSSGCVEPFSILVSDPTATLVDPFGCETELFPSEVDSERAAEFHLVPDNERSGDVDPGSCFVEATGAYLIRSEAEDDEGMDDCGEEPTAVLSNRQSTFSSFTGVSLLASPRHSVSGEPSVVSPPEDGALDLLSPVELSAKLRPFSKVKRGDSIDSGYANGDSWVSPVPFPRSPPRSFPSSVSFLYHSRRTSLPSPAFRGKRVSYDVTTLRPSFHNPIEVIKEVEFDGSQEDHGDAAYTILGTYNASPPEEQGIAALYMNVVQEKSEELDKPSEGPAATCSPRWHSPERLHPTREYDLDSCNQPSFVSDDNLSFRTALSTQPSYEDLSDISRISLVKQDSLLSSISARSTPNTSVLSHYGDVNDLLEQPIIGSHACEPSCVVGQTESTEVPEASALEECPLVEAVIVDSNVSSMSVSASDVQGLAPEKVVAPRGFLSVPSPSVDTSHGLPSTADIFSHTPPDTNDLRNSLPEMAGTSQERSLGLFYLEEQPPRSNPPPERSYSPSINHAFGSCVSGHQEPASENVAASECPVDISHHDRRSTFTDSYSPHSRSDVTFTPACTGDVEESSLRRDLSGVAQLQKLPPKRDSVAKVTFPLSLVNSVVACTFSDPNDVQGIVLDNVVSSPNSHSFLATPDGRSTVKMVRYGALKAEESLFESNEEVSDLFDSECDSFTRCLSFPLPPPFPPTGLVGHSTQEDTSILSERTITNVEQEERDTHTVSQDEGVGRTQSCSNLTKKRPSQLPSIGSSDLSVDFTLRRSRAASDLTVKAKSPPATIPEDAPDLSDSSSPPLEQFQSDSVQSLYDQYFDDDAFNNGSASPGLAYEDVENPGTSGAEERTRGDLVQSSGLTSKELYSVSTSTSDSAPGDSGADSPRSEIALRPLLTGRRSVLRPLAEIVPKANSVDDTELSSPPPPPTRLQVREIGSTMVPLGFRRHKPQSLATRSLRPLHAPLSTLQLREMLSIRTDVAGDDSPPECSSATHVSSATWSPLPKKAMSAPPTSGLRQLCLSSIINKRSSIVSSHSSSAASSIVFSDHSFISPTPQSPTVSSTTSFSHNSSLSSSCAQIPEHTHHTLKRSSSSTVIQQANDYAYFTAQPFTRSDSRSVSPQTQQQKSWRLSHYQAGSRNHTLADGTGRISATSSLNLTYAVDEEQENDDDGTTIPRSIQSSHADDLTRLASVLAAPVHAIATPKPNLLFAIASDDVDQVRQVLENGDASPNDTVGPQSALAFTLTNDKLVHKQEIVKVLLAYGANPTALQDPTLNPAPRAEGGDVSSSQPTATTLEGMDPATRYFVSRADATHTRQTSQLIYRSFFRPLTRVRYDVIGQDWALEQLFRVLSMHSQKLAVAPIVVILCGPSGHGKSLLARKFGFLLDVPTHTVNMTTLRSAHDIWQSYSMSPYEEPSSCTLAEFLIENEGKRCVVVLDEIEKVEDQKALWSLLMPWELGRCSLEAGNRHVDARNVVWLGTSNIGHELVFEHHENRAEPDTRMSREDYLELTAMLRPCVSHCLGASLVSRVTTVLPFVPFTLEEKKAIAAEAVYALTGDASKIHSPQDVESLVVKSLTSYHPCEGARSLHRAISNILVDMV